MPLRSVEAASRDDAIAAAREQFGPQARVVGVRRVRSGGVLGFFATERYVAEVAPDPGGMTAVPPRTPADDDAVPADFSSPLASAAPARARGTAPARNGAAAWAAEAAARSTDDIPAEVRAAAAAARAARVRASARPAATPAPAPAPAPAPTPVRTAAPAWKAPQPATPPADDDGLRELVGLLSTHLADHAAPTYSRATFPRASFPRTGSLSRSSDAPLDDEDWIAPSARDEDQRVIPAAPAAPSPFTAALARMVAGDQDVRQAVQEALAQPAETRPRDDAEPWPVRAQPVRPADSSVPPPSARQEEETVGDQVIAPPSTTDRPVEVPTWAAEPEVAAASVSPREEAIADLLRGALAQGHSDEALAGILRKVLAGASPQTALTEPAAARPAGPVFAVPVLAEPVFAEPAVAVPAEPVFAVPTEPVLAGPALSAPVFAVPNIPVPSPADSAPAAPVTDAPVAPTVAELLPPVLTPAVGTPAVVAEVAPAPAPVVASTPADKMWGTPSSSSLWGEPVNVASAPDVAADAPVSAEVVLMEPTSAPLFPGSTVTEAVVEPVAEAPVVAEPVVVSPVAEAPMAAEQVEAQVVEESVEEYLEEAAIAELAPVLARTASDPAPMMSLDATTVMPPLSLLPPLPSSRGRGRPPVPPVSSRASSRSSASPSAAASTTGAAGVHEQEPDESVAAESPEPATPAPAPGWLATVTRLPVAPLMAGPETPELAEDFDEPGLDDLFAEAPVAAPRAAGATVPPAPRDVAGRLELLGLPAELLGSTFAEDVAERGTYAALTRSLALQLPKAPELPSGTGEAVFVVGPGVDALRAARSLAASLHLDPDCVQWATRGDLAGLAPKSGRVTSVDAAIDRRQESAAAGTVTIVAVDAPLRTDASWMAQMMTVWSPAAVWAVVEATRKPEDLEPWLDRLPRVDALIVQDTDLSADPAAVLRRVNAPVALLDGVRATPHRWASLLCERLESTTS